MTETVRAGTASEARALHGIQWMQWLTRINLGLVALQALSAGLFLSGDGRGVNAHQTGAIALLGGGLAQAVSAAVLWRRGRLPGPVAGHCLVLLVVVLLEMGLGHGKQYWLHLPLGVLIFGGLTWQVIGLDAVSREGAGRGRVRS